MPRLVRTARGELVDFDTIIIKQQLAQAPMNVDVERRKNFIDSKEETGRQRQSNVVDLTAQPAPVAAPTAPQPSVTAGDFEIDAPQPTGKREPAPEPVPELPVRKK